VVTVRQPENDDALPVLVFEGVVGDHAGQAAGVGATDLADAT